MPSDCVEAKGRRGRGQQRVPTLLGVSSCMGADACEAHIEFRARKVPVGAGHDISSVIGGGQVRCHEEVDVIEPPSSDDGMCPSYTLFRRREESLHSACEPVLLLGEHCCEPEAHGGVAIMSTSVHGAFVD